MRRYWLIFAQAVTVCLGILFVVTTLRPDLLRLAPDGHIRRANAAARRLLGGSLPEGDDPVHLGSLLDGPGRPVGEWIAEAHGARRDADGFAFTRKLLDAVVGASDPFGAALGLRKVSRDLPTSMPAVEVKASTIGRNE